MANFLEKIEVAELCKGAHCVDLGESFPTHIFLQTLASTQPRTIPVKLARSPPTDPPGALGDADPTEGKPVKWLRMQEAFPDAKHLFEGIEPTDVCQGGLGPKLSLKA